MLRYFSTVVINICDVIWGKKEMKHMPRRSISKSETKKVEGKKIAKKTAAKTWNVLNDIIRSRGYFMYESRIDGPPRRPNYDNLDYK